MQTDSAMVYRTISCSNFPNLSDPHGVHTQRQSEDSSEASEASDFKHKRRRVMFSSNVDCATVLMECGYKPSSANKMTNTYIHNGRIRGKFLTIAQMVEFLQHLQKGNRGGRRAQLFAEAIRRLEKIGEREEGRAQVTSERVQDENVEESLINLKLAVRSQESAAPTISDPALLENIAALFGVEKSTVSNMRRQGNLFSLIDITSMVAGKDHNYAAQQVRIIQEKYTEMQEIANVQFHGRGQRPTPACDLLTLSHFIMKLPNVDYGKCLKLLTALGVSVDISEEAILIALQKTIAKRPVELPESWVVRKIRKNGFNVVPKIRVGTKIIDATVLLDAGSRALIEVDEKQHQAYGVPAEMTRTLLIEKWAMEERPVGGATWLVRFNPPGFFMFAERKIQVSKASAEQTLMSVLCCIQEEAREKRSRLFDDQNTNESFWILYVYYDCDEAGRALITGDPHVPPRVLSRIRHFDLATQTLVREAIVNSAV